METLVPWVEQSMATFLTTSKTSNQSHVSEIRTLCAVPASNDILNTESQRIPISSLCYIGGSDIGQPCLVPPAPIHLRPFPIDLHRWRISMPSDDYSIRG